MPNSAKRLPVEGTRALLLQTGYDLLMSATAHGDFDIKLADVVAKAHRTTGSAYQIWKSQDEYRRDLAVFVAETVEYADPSPIGEVIGSKLEGVTVLDERIEAVGSAYFDYFISRPEFGAFLRLASISRPDPVVAEAMLRGYDNLQTILGAFLNHAVIVRDQRRFRHGATIESVSSTVTALTEGFALKARFAAMGDPKLAAERIEGMRTDYVNALLAVTHQFTEPES